jgi:hypothetical protein
MFLFSIGEHSAKLMTRLWKMSLLRSMHKYRPRNGIKSLPSLQLPDEPYCRRARAMIESGASLQIGSGNRHMQRAKEGKEKRISKQSDIPSAKID